MIDNLVTLEKKQHILIFPMNYKKITTQSFEKIVVAERQSAVLVFGAEWSGNSEIMDSMMERVSQEFDSSIQFFKVDLEEHNEISHFFGVHSIPTTVFMKDGEIVDLVKGFIPAKKVRKKIKATYLENVED